MYYKEWLRVRRGIMIVVILAAAFLVIHFILLPVMGNPHSGFVIETDGQNAANAARAQSGSGGFLPLSMFFAIAGIAAAICAGIFGGSLSEENDGHLALAWTKPVSRTGYALATMGVDLAFVTFVFALTVGFVAAIIAQHGELGHLRVDGDAWYNLARFLLLAVAWYGLAQGLTASLKQQSGTVRGVSVAIAAILLGLAAADLPPMWHGLVQLVNYFNPLAYASYSFPQAQPPYPFGTWGLNLVGLALIAALGLAAALVQWRRLEA